MSAIDVVGWGECVWASRTGTPKDGWDGTCVRVCGRAVGSKSFTADR